MVIADLQYLAARVGNLRKQLDNLSDWIDNPDRPFPGDAVALADELRRVAELLVARDDEGTGAAGERLGGDSL